jgi:predicted  nucleic acid-binding Zn-ribbon protein|tara:strand:+ start:2960 stop:3289 length:330 start_codon:yes stop_codon:yes gene_type:complete
MKLKDPIVLTEDIKKLDKKIIKLKKQNKEQAEEISDLNEYIDVLEAQIADYKARFVPDFEILEKGGAEVPISDLKIMSDKAKRSMAKRFLKRYGEEWVRVNILENEKLK